MKSHIIALAAFAAIGFAGAAYAGDATAPKAMTDAEMDQVTAGAAGGIMGPPGTIIVEPGSGQPIFLPGGGTAPPDVNVITPQGVVKPPDGIPPGT